MKIDFLISGFPNGFTNEFISELKPHIHAARNFVFIASDFSKHAAAKRYSEVFLECFRNKGII